MKTILKYGLLLFLLSGNLCSRAQLIFSDLDDPQKIAFIHARKVASVTYYAAGEKGMYKYSRSGKVLFTGGRDKWRNYIYDSLDRLTVIYQYTVADSGSYTRSGVKELISYRITQNAPKDTLLQSWHYTYDAAGKRIKSEYKDPDGILNPLEQPASVIGVRFPGYLIDSVPGKKIITHYETDSSTRSREFFTYNEKGQLLKKQEYVYIYRSISDSVLVVDYSNTYHPSGFMQSSQRKEYELTGKGNKFRLSRNEKTTYDEWGNMTEDLSYWKYSRPQKYHLQLRYVYSPLHLVERVEQWQDKKWTTVYELKYTFWE